MPDVGAGASMTGAFPGHPQIFQGFKIVTLLTAKSFSFLVTTIRLYVRATAAIKPSIEASDAPFFSACA